MEKDKRRTRKIDKNTTKKTIILLLIISSTVVNVDAQRITGYAKRNDGNVQSYNETFYKAYSLYKANDYFYSYLNFKNARRLAKNKKDIKLCRAYMDTTIVKIKENRIELTQKRKSVDSLNSVILANNSKIKKIENDKMIYKVKAEKDSSDARNKIIGLEQKNKNLTDTIGQLETKITTLEGDTIELRKTIFENKKIIVEQNNLITELKPSYKLASIEFENLKLIADTISITAENKKVINQILIRMELLANQLPIFKNDYNKYKEKFKSQIDLFIDPKTAN